MAFIAKSSTFEENRINPERNVLLEGFATPRNLVSVRHPLEKSEATYKERMDAVNFSMLKSVQGIQAPLRLLMERRAASKVGRLPFLHSSNLMRDVLEGNDDIIQFEDFLNDVSMPEVMGSPHMILEKQLGIL